MADKYQDWYTNRVFKQLNRCVEAYNVKVDVQLTDIKFEHAKSKLIKFGNGSY